MKAFRVATLIAIAVVSMQFAVLAFAPPARAVARLYTFEGLTTDNYDPAPPNTLPAGQFVSYTFLVDFDGTGSSSLGGVQTTKIDDGEYDYFYVRFVSGTNLYPRPAADPADTVSYNYGFDHSGSFSAGFLFGAPTGYKFNSVTISSGQPVSDWAVGDAMVGEDAVGTPLDPDFAWVVSSLELKSISTVASPSAEVAKLMVIINNFPSPVFKNKNMRKALTNKLDALVPMLGQENYAEALEKLRNDILEKTDGCAKYGKPDSNDWIKDCGVQGQFYPAVVAIIELVQQMVE